MTFAEIMERMLRRVREADANLDTRVGSIIYSALAPAAAELANLYIEAGAVLDETFADTASWDFLVRRCAERGITPKPATAAVWKGQFNAAIPEGARFSCGLLNFVMTDGRLVCETLGEAGNAAQGELVPIEYIPGLTVARLGELLIPGEEPEDIERLRARYFASFDSQAYGGNVADYREKVNALPGVGGCRVYPVWNGGGTVKVAVISAQFAAPPPALVAAVQEALEEIAPIGHTVTVAGVRGREVTVTVSVALEPDYAWEDVLPYAREAVDGYFLELARSWPEGGALVVRLSQIETRLLALDGVLDVADAAIDGAAANLTLEEEEIPVRGDLIGQELA